MNKILLIGKTGQVGRELIKILDNNVLLAPSIDEFDIFNYEQVADYIRENRPQVIINTAAFHNLHECEQKPYLAFKINCLAVKNLALLAKSLDALFFHFSTNYVFDGAKDGSYAETDTTNPLQIYGMSKLSGEESILYNYPQRSLIIRTSVLFGGEGSPDKGGNFVLNRLKDINKNTLEIDGAQLFSITYAKDLAGVVKKFIEDANVKSGIYHVVNEGECSWLELTKFIFDLKKSKCILSCVDRNGRDGELVRPIKTVLGIDKIKSIGISMSSWKDAVRQYLIEIGELQ